MPDLKYLSRVLYILIYCFFRQIVYIFLTTLTIKSRIALKLQIGKDDDKKESKYQKYIYYASNGYQYYGESGKTPIQNYFEKGLYENLSERVDLVHLHHLIKSHNSEHSHELTIRTFILESEHSHELTGLL
jgi:hypothetical protein